jgi:hypothetical protein
MSDADKPNPIDDLRKGLGLLFRAAKTTIEKLPTGQIEEAVISGAKEVGRAIENVTHSVEEQFLRKPSARADDPSNPPSKSDSAAPGAEAPGAKAQPEKTPPDDPKTRVG